MLDTSICLDNIIHVLITVLWLVCSSEATENSPLLFRKMFLEFVCQLQTIPTCIDHRYEINNFRFPPVSQLVGPDISLISSNPGVIIRWVLWSIKLKSSNFHQIDRRKHGPQRGLWEECPLINLNFFHDTWLRWMVLCRNK